MLQSKGRKRKEIDEFAAENSEDITVRQEFRENGQLVRSLVCRFCYTTIVAHNYRIREHLKSKRHQKLKLEADLTQQQYLGGTLNSTLLPSIPKLPDDNRRIEMSSSSSPHNNTTSRAPHLLPTESIQSSSALINTMTGGRLTALKLATITSKKENDQEQEEEEDVTKIMEPQKLLCVKWENFNSNMVSMLTKLQSQNHFLDVTLWCEGKTIKCHKLILSAGSKYFEKLFTENIFPYHHHPIIFLKDMRFWEITALVEFLYKGQVNVHENKLQALIRAAQSLKIKDLGSPEWNNIIDDPLLTQEDDDQGQNESEKNNYDPPRDRSMDILTKTNNSSEINQQTKQYLQNNNHSDETMVHAKKRRRKTTPKRLNIQQKEHNNSSLTATCNSIMSSDNLGYNSWV